MLFTYFLCSVSWQIFTAVAIMLSNSYFAILLMSNSLVNSKVLNLELFIEYVVHLLLDDLGHGIFSEL